VTVQTRAQPTTSREDRPIKAPAGEVSALVDRLLGGGHRRAVALILAAGLGVFANSVVNDFVFDDRGIILNNPYIRHFARPAIIFLTGYWPDPRLDLLYRPLVISSYAVNYAIGGFTPWGYHLVNIVLHAANGALAYVLLWKLFGSRYLAFFSALAFALHPIHTEAVANVVGRAELMAAFFFFLAWLAYLRARDAVGFTRSAMLGSSLLCFGLALLSKEHAAVLLGALILSDLLRAATRGPGGSAGSLIRAIARPLRTTFPWYLGVFGLYTLVRYLVLGAFRTPVNDINFVDNPIVKADQLSQLLTATKVLGRYLWLLLFPHHLSADYSYNVIPLSRAIGEPAVLLTLVAVASLAVLVWIARHRRPALCFGVVFLGIAILPVSNLIFPIGTIMAERIVYLPSLGFCLAFGAAMEAGLLWAGSRSRAAAGLMLGLFVVVGALYATKTVLRNRVWRDEAVFAETTLRDVPDSSKMHKMFGTSLVRKGRYDEAIHEYEKALRIYPDYYEAYNDLGIALALQGKGDEALKVFQTAANSWPKYADPHYHMGKIYEAKGMKTEAEQAYRRAGEGFPIVIDVAVGLALALYRLRLIPEAQRQLEDAVWRKPESAEVRNNLGLLYLELNRLGDARRQLQVAARFRPNSPEVWTNLGKVVQRQGETDRARWAFEKALSLKPDYADAKQSLGVLLSGQGSLDEAIRKLEEAVQIDPRNAEALHHLGAVYGRKGDLKRAEQAFLAVVRLDQQNAEAHYNLGTVYAREGKLADARRELETAIRLRPQYAKAHHNLGVLFRQLGRAADAQREFEIARQQGMKAEGEVAIGSAR
jgi:Flp pilus assembly protein TadD